MSLSNPENFLSESKIKYKRFIDFLSESNHGIYNKDVRLKFLVNKLIDSIKLQFNLLTINRFENISGIISNIEIETHPPAIKELLDIDIHWKIIKDNFEPEYRENFFKLGQAIYDLVKGKAYINILLVKAESQTKGNFYNEVKDFIENDLKTVLLHEIKHILDRIDKRNNYRKIPKPSELSYENGKYQSSDRKIYNFLLTLIGEIEKIKNKNPELCFTNVIKKSKWYHKILDPMDQNKRNKLKSKLIDFWIENYGTDDLN